MTLCRAVLSCLSLVVLCGGAACGTRESSEQRAAPAAPPPVASSGALDAAAEAPPAADAAVASVDVPYALAVAHTLAPLPEAPAAYVFVEPNGNWRVGTSPAFAAATEVGDVASLRKLLPPPPPPPPPPPAAGGGMGTTSGGFGIGGGGTLVAHELQAVRSAPADARIVIVPARGAPIDAVARAMAATDEPIAVAVAGDAGGVGALALPLRSGRGGGTRFDVSLSSVGGDVTDLEHGTSTHIAGGPGAMVDAAALRAHLDGLYAASGADTTIALRLFTHAFASDLVAGLDAMAGGVAPVPITVRGRGGMRSGRIRSPQVRLGNPSILGTMDKTLIRRMLKRHIAQITYCYEKQLLIKPGLQGTVTATFVIGPKGDVPSSQATGMDPVVATCIAGVIHRIEFPSPKGGEIVKVSYPLTFQLDGGG